MTEKTLQRLPMRNGEHLEEKSIAFVQDSLAKPSLLQENEEDFQTLEELCFSRLQGQLNKSNHAFYSLRTSKGYYLTTKGETFATILATLDELGYDAQWQVFNSKDFGVPQTRERVFIVGYPRGQSGREILSFGENDEVFEPTEQSNKPQPHTPLCTTIRTKIGSRADDTFVIQRSRGNNKGGVHNISPTLTTNSFQDNNLLISEEQQARKLTPRECFRLQGFPDWAFDRAKGAGVSDSQLYKQAGNSVTVNVIYEIARRLR